MNQDSARLVAKIEAFELDEPGAADPFSARLARENGWSELHARLVMREYKRFLALAVTVKHVVTPSEQVDQAWHLHLLYSARYRQFCSEILGRTLDHGPSNGGQVELEHFTSAYEQTLASYQERFGEAAPQDIWPPPAVRFGAGRLARRVSDAEHWVLCKPGVWRWLEARLPRRLLTWPKLLWVGLACLAAGASVSSHISGHDFLVGYFLLWSLSLIVAYGAKLLVAPDATCDDAVLEPYELLQLARGPLGAVDGAVTALIAQQALTFEAKTSELRAVGALPDAAAALERRVWSELEQSGDLSVTTLRRKAAELTRATAQRLEALGLMTTGKQNLPFWLALIMPSLGLVRIVSRLGTDKPVAGLVMSCFLSVLVALLFRAKVERTAHGNALLDRTRIEHRETPASELVHAGLLPLSIALFGFAAVALPEASSWTGWLSRASVRADASGGCGSGCGGSSCGGDGGGCGGGCGGCGGD